MAKWKSYQFKYVGDPNDRFSGPDTIHQYGVEWKKGEAATIEFDEEDEKDRQNLRKLKDNSHFLDMSDKDEASDVTARQKALEKAEADRERAEEEQRKRDEADEKQRQKNLEKSGGSSPAANAPRPPGSVTREPVTDAFGGRPVEERTQAEDHTKAGKTKS